MKCATRTLALAALAALLAVGCGSVKRCAYAGPGRDDWQQPDRVVEALAIEPGSRVADLGAGGGYFTFRLAEAVGPQGRVYAVDVDPDMTSFLDEEAAARGLAQVQTVLAAAADPSLPEPVDLVFVSNTYHHLPDPVAYFGNARQYLRPGARIAIVEYRPGGFFGRFFPHDTEADAIRTEMERAGYELVEEPAFLERQSFLIFR